MGGFLFPSTTYIPVQGASEKDWHPQSFWYFPWGKSGVHKGVDIFAETGRPITAASPGIVLFSGYIHRGGNVVLALTGSWRLHYYAHLEKIYVHPGDLIATQKAIGTVGDSGNAKGKPAHLHFSIVTLIPYPWRLDLSPQGWKKMFYLNPITLFFKS